MTARAVLDLKGVSKTFPGVVALEEVSLEVSEGEVHALLGENGAGKSTLMAIAAGAMAANSGTIEIGGIFLDAASPSRAQELGIAVVYQDTSVLHELTVAENLLYCVPKERRSATINTYQWISEQLALVGAVFDRRTRVGELGVAERQLVEIAKALALQPEVLVLDEPTEALTAKETEQLFVNIERITALGTAVVYISHRLPEVKRVADRITVLRDGKVCGTFLADGISEREIFEFDHRASGRSRLPGKGRTTHRQSTPSSCARDFKRPFAEHRSRGCCRRSGRPRGRRRKRPTRIHSLARWSRVGRRRAYYRRKARGALRTNHNSRRRYRLPPRRQAFRGPIHVALGA